MLSAQEKRFLRYWEEQRTGGFGSYFLLYEIIGTLILTLFTSLVLHFFLNMRFAWPLFLTVLGCSVVISSVVIYFVWRSSERRFKGLIHRELKQKDSTRDLV